MKVAIYRKYRPKKFEEVLGQDHIVEILKGAVKSKKISHAYLFSGPRGTGKTSVARIFAGEIGCHQYDLLEIDAASSRGIDEVRALREGVNTLPLNSPYKVYIIDEVHMLTKEAFNALLKTLEEPPSHAVFILATTEPEKLPETIISRCQRFDFKKIPEDLIKKNLLEISRSEGFVLNEEAASLIAFFADGSFRDAQTMLDQLFNLGKESISLEEVKNFLSIPPKSLVEKFILAFIENSVSDALEVVDVLTKKNFSLQLFLKLALRNLRFLFLMKLSPGLENKLEEMLSEKELIFLKEQKEKISLENLGFILVNLLEVYDKLKSEFLPQLPLEIAIARIYLRMKKLEGRN